MNRGRTVGPVGRPFLMQTFIFIVCLKLAAAYSFETSFQAALFEGLRPSSVNQKFFVGCVSKNFAPKSRLGSRKFDTFMQIGRSSNSDNAGRTRIIKFQAGDMEILRQVSQRASPTTTSANMQRRSESWDLPPLPTGNTAAKRRATRWTQGKPPGSRASPHPPKRAAVTFPRGG